MTRILDTVINDGEAIVSGTHTSLSTTITLLAGERAKLPDITDKACNLVWYLASKYDRPKDDPNSEVVRYTATSGTNDIIVTRAQEGTTATAKNLSSTGYRLVSVLTAKMIVDIEMNLSKMKTTYVVGPAGSGVEYECDGTNDEIQIQEAIDDCNTAGGGTVQFLVGTYNVGTYIILKSNVILEGTKGLSIIKRASADTTHKVIYNESANAASNFRIRNLVIDHNETAPVALRRSIWLDGCSNFNIENVKFINVSKESLTLVGCYNFGVENIDTYSADKILTSDGFNFYSCYNFFVDKCYFEVGDDGVGIRSCYNGQITNITRTGAPGGGAVKFGTGGLATDNHDINVDNVIDTNGTGYTVSFIGTSGKDAIATSYNLNVNNIIGISNKSVVYISGSPVLQDGTTFTFKNISISNIKGLNCSGPSISSSSLYNVKNIVFSNGHLENTQAQRLIKLSNGNDVTFRDFYLKGTGSDGMLIGNPTSGLPDNIKLENVLFDSCGSNGLYIGNATTNMHISIKRCEFRNNTSDGIEYLDSSNFIEIEDCKFSGNGGYAINNVTNSRIKTYNCEFNNNTSGAFVTNPIMAQNNYGTDITDASLFSRSRFLANLTAYTDICRSPLDTTASNVFHRNMTAADTAGAVVAMVQEHAGDDQDVLSMKQDGSGRAIYIDHNYNSNALYIEAANSSAAVLNINCVDHTVPAILTTGYLESAKLKINQDNDEYGIDIDSEATTKAGIHIVTGQGATAARFLSNSECYTDLATDITNATANNIFYRNLDAASTNCPLAMFFQDHATDDQDVVNIRQDGTGKGLFIDQNKNNYGIHIDSEATTKAGLQIDMANVGYVGFATNGVVTAAKFNALVLTSATVGFTIAGGTTSKTLTVPLDASVSGTNTGDVTLAATNHGLGLSGQVITLGTPSTLTASTTNAVTTTTHTHAITGFSTIVKTGIAKISGGNKQYGVPGNAFNTVTTLAPTVNRLYYYPVKIPYAVTLTDYMFEVTVAPASDGNIRFGIYAADADMQPTGNPIWDSGSIAVASTFTGIKNGTGLSIVLPPGMYLMCYNTDQAMTLRFLQTPSNSIYTVMGTSPFIYGFYEAQAYGAFSSPGTVWTNLSRTSSGTAHNIFWQWTE